MANPSTVFTQMVSATNRNWGKEVVDNISDQNVFINVLKKKGKINTISGGYEIARQVEYAENTTYQRFGGYDALNTDASDTLTSVVYPLRQIALHVTASGFELRTNMSKEKMIDFVKQRKANALRTAANQFSIDLYSSGALSNQINGLANLVQTDGNGTVGGIDASTTDGAFWRNQFREATGTNTAATPTLANSTQFIGDMNALYLSLVFGMDKPDTIVMSHDFFALYEVAFQDKIRYMSNETAKGGFHSYVYKPGTTVYFDNNTNFTSTAERAYFLNTDYLYLAQHKEAQWTPDDEKVPVNQDAVVIPFYWMGNLVLTNRSRQGILFDAA